MTQSFIDATVGDRPICVVLGSGGVGKTTVSAAMGMALSSLDTGRVLVLTVDPARRLASALGLAGETIGADPVTVDPSRLRGVGIASKGRLDVAMLDAKSAWDRMVMEYAPSREVAERIMANRFYGGISDAFVGSHEYIAMEALYEIHRRGEYDRVIIDTPPSRSALDFLEAPDRFTDFVGARLLSWLAGPSGLGLRAMNFAAAPLLKVVDRLLGAETLVDLAAFVRDIQGMYAGVRERSGKVYRLLRSRSTAFLVVTTPEVRPFAEATYFQSKLAAYRMPLRGLVINRVLPETFGDRGAVIVAERLRDRSQGDRSSTGHLDRRLADLFLSFHEMEDTQHRLISEGNGMNVPVAQIPWVVPDIYSLASVASVARTVGATPHRSRGVAAASARKSAQA